MPCLPSPGIWSGISHFLALGSAFLGVTLRDGRLAKTDLLLPNPERSGLAGSLELQLPDMVRGARGPELCSVRLARDGAAPRCNLFRCHRLRGWWPVVKLREPEDEEQEQREAQTGKKRRKKRKGRREDLEFSHSGGNVYVLTVGRSGGGRGGRVGLRPPKNLASVPSFPGKG